MDYLLRDSLHLGVAYGTFDVERLTSSLRIIGQKETDVQSVSDRLSLGISHGGLHVAESLVLARYFMTMQVYYHHARASFDHHLRQFVNGWLQSPITSEDPAALLSLTDNEVLVAIAEAAVDVGSDLYRLAEPLFERRQYKRIMDADPSMLAGDGLARFRELADAFVGSLPGVSAQFIETVRAPRRPPPVRTWSGEVKGLDELTDVIRWPSDVGMKTTMGRGYIFVRQDHVNLGLTKWESLTNQEPRSRESV